MNLIATFDLETSNLEGAWGRLLVASSIKPYNSDKITTLKQKRNSKRSDDYQVVKETIAELSKYSIWIAHNGTRFDIPFLNARALAHNLPLIPRSQKVVDPCTVASSNCPDCAGASTQWPPTCTCRNRRCTSGRNLGQGCAGRGQGELGHTRGAMRVGRAGVGGYYRALRPVAPQYRRLWSG